MGRNGEVELQRALSPTDTEKVKKNATDNTAAEHVVIKTRKLGRNRCNQKDEQEEL